MIGKPLGQLPLEPSTSPTESTSFTSSQTGVLFQKTETTEVGLEPAPLDTELVKCVTLFTILAYVKYKLMFSPT